MIAKYTTVQGDMWDSIAKKVYSDEYLMHYLMDANPKQIATVIFPAGVTLTIPDIPVNSAVNLPPWRRSK